MPVVPPVSPMLAKPVKDFTAVKVDVLYEPKWDGFRSIIFRSGDLVEIGSRNEKPMTRYFPEVVEAVLANFPDKCVIDGEIVLVSPSSGDRLDFDLLQQRILIAGGGALLVALALGYGGSWMFARRIKRLERAAECGRLERVVLEHVAGRVPVIFSSELYATPALLGATWAVLAAGWGLDEAAVTLPGVVLTARSRGPDDEARLGQAAEPIAFACIGLPLSLQRRGGRARGLALTLAAYLTYYLLARAGIENGWAMRTIAS